MKYIITESQYRLLTEIRGGMLNYLIKKSKEHTGTEWPEYVIKDWMYKKTTDVEGLTSMFKFFIDRFGIGRWEYKVLDVSIDIFTDDDQKILKKKMGGIINQDVPNDMERHNLQQSQLETKGISPEPIILYQTKDGKYDLIEGWHRTTASLKKYGNYKQNAWVYINI
jgi:hypothetical protein